MKTLLSTTCKGHLTLEPFRLKHKNSTDFVISQWQWDRNNPSVSFTFYRVGLFILYFVSWIFTYLNQPPLGKAKWPIYLTNWGFTLCVVQSLLSSIMVTVSLFASKMEGKNERREKVIKLYPAYWALNSTATPVAFTISIIYWSLIFKAEGATFTAMNFIVHGLNSILVFLDLLIVSHPVKIFHFIYPLFLALCYTVFTVVYYIAGGTTKTGSRYIYPILKWDEPGKTMGVCAGVMVLMIVLHLFTYLVYKLRVYVFRRFLESKIEKPLPEKEQHHDSPQSFDNKALEDDYV